MQWAFADASSVSDAVVRSQSGRIIQNTLTDAASAGPETSTYRFDAAGRLVRAEVPRHVLEYGFGAGVCGMIGSAAGANGNRTSFADTFDGGTPTTVAYCYEDADRLTGTTGQRGISDDMVDQAIKTGKKSKGKTPGTTKTPARRYG